MKEKDLEKLGFNKEIVTAEESGDNEFYYFTYEFPNKFCLISTSNDVGEEFVVELFNESDFSFSNADEVGLLIDILKRNTKKIEENG